MLNSLDDGLPGCRDRALLLVGFAGGFRRSELASLAVEDLQETADGLVIRVRRSKTYPEAQGTSVALPYGSTAATCPVRSYRAWIAAAGIETGPAFRSVDRHGRVGWEGMNAGSVARLIKRAAAAAGLDPARYAAHSLRAGFATQAFLYGAAEVSIMRQISPHDAQVHSGPLAVPRQPGLPTRALTRGCATPRAILNIALRVSELCELRWRNLQPLDEGGQITVFGKGGLTRAIQLPASVWKLLIGLRPPRSKADEPVFLSHK